VDSPSPLVSVITPSYNQGGYIEDTLRSVLLQDYRAIEHIVVDGGSTDGTVDILGAYGQSYPDRIRWVSEPDNGQADAVNKGIALSKGDIVGWLNSDDFYASKSAVEEAVGAFVSNPGIAVVYGDNIEIDSQGALRKLFLRPDDVSFSRLLRGDVISQPATFLRGDAARANLLQIDLDYVMDYELWLRLAQTGYRFHHLPRVIAAARWHKSAKSASGRRALELETLRVRSSYGFDNGWLTVSKLCLDVAGLAWRKVLGAWVLLQSVDSIVSQSPIPIAVPSRLDVLLSHLNLVREVRPSVKFLFES
jgi:glycosyltransferase involved in cell wall biosynthesis